MEAQKLQLTGGNHQKTRRALDYYPTPPDVTIALMSFLGLPPCKIWEPACGDGAMASVLSGLGHEVYASDIRGDSGYGEGGVDYLMEDRRGEYDAIITNPPFDISDKFILKALREANIVAMLLKSQYWHAKKRMQLFNDHPPAWVLPLTWRPDFLFNERVNGERSAPTMEVAWTVWLSDNNMARYKPLPKPMQAK